MNQKNTRNLAALAIVLGAFAVPVLQAQSAEQELKPKGTKAAVTLALTLTEEVGGFYVTDAQVEKDAAKFITYNSEDLRNPIGFDGVAKAANYYIEKKTMKYRAKVDGESVNPTEETVVYSEKALATRYGNAEFIVDLINKDIIPSSSTKEKPTVAEMVKGYSIVAVNFGDEDHPYPNPFFYFFVEKAAANGTQAVLALIGTSITYDIMDDGLSGLPLQFTVHGDAETSTETISTKTAYKPVKLEDGETSYEAQEPKSTYSETSSGTADVGLRIFRSDDVAVLLGGHVKISSSYNATSKVMIDGAISGTLAGSIVVMESDYEGIASGTLSVAASKYVADLSAYAQAAEIAPPVAPSEE